MTTTTVSSKGQLVIPKDIREELGIKAGAQYVVKRWDNTIMLIPKPEDLDQALRDLRKKLRLGDMSEEIKRHRRMEHR